MYDFLGFYSKVKEKWEEFQFQMVEYRISAAEQMLYWNS